MKLNSPQKSGSKLYTGDVTDEFFILIIDISPLRSSKVIRTFRDYFVFGISRKKFFLDYNVNPEYLSVKIKEIQLLHERIFQVFHFLLRSVLSSGKIIKTEEKLAGSR